jgi:hypothetical protein
VSDELERCSKMLEKLVKILGTGLVAASLGCQSQTIKETENISDVGVPVVETQVSSPNYRGKEIPGFMPMLDAGVFDFGLLDSGNLDAGVRVDSAVDADSGVVDAETMDSNITDVHTYGRVADLTIPYQVSFLEQGTNKFILVNLQDGSAEVSLLPRVFSDGSFSPDGNKYVFSGGDLYVADLTAQGKVIRVTNLTNTPTISENHPIWAPTDDIISYITGNGRGAELYTLDVIGGGVREVTANMQSPGPFPNLYSRSWSGDSKRIAFTFPSSRNANNVFLADNRTNSVAQLTTGTNKSLARFSPTEEKIAYVDVFSVYIMNSDGTGAREVYQASSDIMCLGWSPDGQSIAVFSEYDPISIVDQQGNNFQLTNPVNFEPRCPWGGNDFDWGPNSSALIVQARGSTNRTDIIYMGLDGNNANITNDQTQNHLKPKVRPN